MPTVSANLTINNKLTQLTGNLETTNFTNANQNIIVCRQCICGANHQFTINSATKQQY